MYRKVINFRISSSNSEVILFSGNLFNNISVRVHRIIRYRLPPIFMRCVPSLSNPKHPFNSSKIHGTDVSLGAFNKHRTRKVGVCRIWSVIPFFGMIVHFIHFFGKSPKNLPSHFNDITIIVSFRYNNFFQFFFDQALKLLQCIAEKFQGSDGLFWMSSQVMLGFMDNSYQFHSLPGPRSLSGLFRTISNVMIGFLDNSHQFQTLSG